ncbi:hypothetical protein DFH09DRAFT_290863 [Mycena vulgaris]|nr:hypothetical protein DFH09DRAFT_290863 [Mycena vulgaris]
MPEMHGIPSDVDHATGTRDVSRPLWVFVLEIEGVTHNLGLERPCTPSGLRTGLAGYILPTTRVLDSFVPGVSPGPSPSFRSLASSRRPSLFFEQRKAYRTGYWWPEPSAFPLGFDRSPAEERPNPGAVSVEFRAPWVTLSSSAAIFACRWFEGEAQKRRRAHRDSHGFTSRSDRRLGVGVCVLNSKGHEQESTGSWLLAISRLS